jgi:glucose/mannose-6-phosphate isomerase
MTDPISLEPPYGARDPRGMAALIDALPEHIEQALERVAASAWRPPVASPALLAVGGMGGSAIAAELTAAAAWDRAPKPILVVRDYRWPAWIGRDSLVVLSSNSGDTEETLALADDAARRGAPCMVIASGGKLVERGRVHGWPVHQLPGGMPPRAALFHGWVPLTALLAELGWMDDPRPAWREAAALLREQRGALGTTAAEASNPVKQLARALHGHVVQIASGPGAVAAVATRWRQQLNENAKVFAHSAVVPEQNHNEIVGWQVRGPATRSVGLLVLRDAEDPVEVSTRLDLLAEYAARQGAAVYEIRSQGESRIARLAFLVQYGDSLSLHMALLGGVDPTDIASIDEFKRRLAERKSVR